MVPFHEKNFCIKIELRQIGQKFRVSGIFQQQWNYVNRNGCFRIKSPVELRNWKRLNWKLMLRTTKAIQWYVPISLTENNLIYSGEFEWDF